MDIASIIGIIAGIGLMIFGITADDGFAALTGFFDRNSIFITFGGAFSATLMMCKSVPVFLSSMKSIGIIFKKVTNNEQEAIKSIIDLSNIARKDGLLALEEASNTIDNEFMKKGIMLIVDGTEPELVRSIMETELGCIEERHKKVIEFWDYLGAMGPAWGMIGTLIGLINMLSKMEDSATVGPSMAVALVTTFYGSVLANWICTPVSTKLKSNSDAEMRMKEIMVEGVLSIQAGENPRVIEEKLKSFLSPATRNSMNEEQGGEQLG